MAHDYLSTTMETAMMIYVPNSTVLGDPANKTKQRPSDFPTVLYSTLPLRSTTEAPGNYPIPHTLRTATPRHNYHTKHSLPRQAQINLASIIILWSTIIPYPKLGSTTPENIPPETFHRPVKKHFFFSSNKTRGRAK